MLGARRLSPIALFSIRFVTTSVAIQLWSAPNARGDEDLANAIFVADVVDGETGEPISEFSALAGTGYLPELGWQWQPHTLYPYRDGKLRWPPPKRRGYEKQVLRIEAEGYMPFETPEIVEVDGAPPLRLTIRLIRDEGIDARVLTPQGEPAADAEVAMAMANRTITLQAGKMILRPAPASATPRDRWVEIAPLKTDANGEFHLPSEAGRATLVVTHPKGVAILNFDEFAKSPTVKLEKWGTLEGRVMWGDVVGPHETITLIAHGAPEKNGNGHFFPVVSHIEETTSDETGRFEFRHVPPGTAQLSRDNALPYQHHEVAAGGTTKVVFGGTGRTVIGKLTGRDSWEDARIRIAPNAPRPGDMGTKHDPWPAYSKFLASPAGKKYMHKDVPIANDGSFRIDHVLPEHYQLFAAAPDVDGKLANIGYASFHVAPLNEAELAEPQDLGTIKVRQ